MPSTSAVPLRGPSSQPTLTFFETCRSVIADGACSVNATLYTKYDDCLIDALSGIVNKSDSVSGNRVPTRVVITTTQSSGAGPSRTVLLLPHSESRYMLEPPREVNTCRLQHRYGRPYQQLYPRLGALV